MAWWRRYASPTRRYTKCERYGAPPYATRLLHRALYRKVPSHFGVAHLRLRALGDHFAA